MISKSGCASMASRKGSGPIWATTVGVASISADVRRGTKGPQPVIWPDWRRCRTRLCEILLLIERTLRDTGLDSISLEYGPRWTANLWDTREHLLFHFVQDLPHAIHNYLNVGITPISACRADDQRHMMIHNGPNQLAHVPKVRRPGHCHGS